MDIKEIKHKIPKVLDEDQDDGSLVFEQIYCRYNITPREKDIIKYFIKGNENKEISTKINISTETVKNHIKNIFEMCRVQNRVEPAGLFLNVRK